MEISLVDPLQFYIKHKKACALTQKAQQSWEVHFSNHMDYR